MSKWAPANEYVPVTKGSTAVITLQSDGDVYGYMDASTTGVLLASASAGVTKVPTGSFSKITCTAPFILTTEAPSGPILKPTSGGDSGAEAIMSISADGETLTFDLRNYYDTLPTYILPQGFTRIAGSIGSATTCRDAFRGSTKLAICDIDLSSVTNLTRAFLSCTSLAKVNSEFTAAQNISSAFQSTAITEWTKDLPAASNLGQAFFDGKLTRWKSSCPKATSISLIFYNCPLADFDIDFPLVETFNFTSASNAALGRAKDLTNVTVPAGGLNSCTTFKLSNKHTAITDASIQNIVDALPDWSGTGTTALVQFPPGRLTAEQQATLTAKGWTWSEATD